MVIQVLVGDLHYAARRVPLLAAGEIGDVAGKFGLCGARCHGWLPLSENQKAKIKRQKGEDGKPAGD